MLSQKQAYHINSTELVSQLYRLDSCNTYPIECKSNLGLVGFSHVNDMKRLICIALLNLPLSYYSYYQLIVDKTPMHVFQRSHDW